MADKYKNWKDLTEKEKEGEDYKVETVEEYSDWSHLAVHGGGMELMTSSIAREVAARNAQNYASLLGIKEKDNNDLHLGVTKFDAPWAEKMQKGVEYTLSFHGLGDTDKETIYVGGNDPGTRKKVVDALKKAGFKFSDKVKEDGANSDKNISAKNKRKKGVHLEFTRKFRDSLVESGDSKDEGKSKTTEVFEKLVIALSSVAEPDKVYQSWKAFYEHEKEGEDYALGVWDRNSNWSHLAIHAGYMELWTSHVAKSVADINKQKAYLLEGLKPERSKRQRINATKFEEPKCQDLQKKSKWSVSYHGISDEKDDPKGGLVYVGGRDKKTRDGIEKALKDAGFNTKIGGKEADGNHDDEKNIVNRNKSKAGVQLELNLTLRNSFSSTGSAKDQKAEPTQKFLDFVRAVASATSSGDEYQSWEELEANEKEGYDYEIELEDAGSEVTHLAIHGGVLEAMTASLAREAAKKKKQSYFAVVTEDGDTVKRMKIPSTKFNHPDCVELQKSAYYSVSYHGLAEVKDEPAEGLVLVGGLAERMRDMIAEELRAKGFIVEMVSPDESFNVELGGEEGKGDHESPDNIVNKTSSGGGVQLELSRRLRDRMSSSGRAGDEDARKTQTFWDFIGAVGKVSSIPDKPEKESGDQKCIRYFINGFNLDQPREGFKLMKETEYAPAISPRRFALEIPMFHGQIPMWQDPIDKITVQLEVRVMGKTTSELRQKWDDFCGLCGAGKFAPIMLERYRGIYLSTDTDYDPLDRNKSFGEYANAQLESLSTPEFEPGSKQLLTKAVFNVPVGQWRSHKIYLDRYTKNGEHERCVSAKASTLPVYSMIIRVQGGSDGKKQLGHWSVVDEQSDTGVAWSDPTGINLNDGEFLYADTDTMRAYIAKERTWPQPGESFGAFVKRIKAKPAWSNFRYIRNGPLSLTSKVQYVDGTESNPDFVGLEHRSGVRVVMHTADGKNVEGRELVIRSRAARI